jgi:hypothetical protein
MVMCAYVRHIESARLPPLHLPLPLALFGGKVQTIIGWQYNVYVLRGGEVSAFLEGEQSR